LDAEGGVGSAFPHNQSHVLEASEAMKQQKNLEMIKNEGKTNEEGKVDIQKEGKEEDGDYEVEIKQENMVEVKQEVMS